MITINVFLTIKEEKKSAYLTLIKALAEESNKESGCHLYRHYNSVDYPNEYAILEHWENQEAIDKHNATPHFKHFVNEINEYLAEELIIQVLH